MKVLRKFLKHKFIIGTLFMIVSIVALVTALIQRLIIHKLIPLIKI